MWPTTRYVPALAGCVVAVALWSAPARADLYKCQSPTGAVVYQDHACQTGGPSVPLVVSMPAPGPVTGLQAVQSLGALEDLGHCWNHVLVLAESTGRIALTHPVSQLQALLQEAERFETAPCMLEAQRALVRTMGATIESFLHFMQRAEASLRRARDRATTFTHDYERAMRVACR